MHVIFVELDDWIVHVVPAIDTLMEAELVGNPVPVIVRLVPPPVPPLAGLTEVRVGVRAVLYSKFDVLTIEFTVTDTLQFEFIVGVED
jgi:NADPH:quinone reductase-like Zn-dependent oxidoreductase